MEEQGMKAQDEVVQLVELFPSVTPEQVPQSVWEKVSQGMSLALAYCLWRLEGAEDALERRERDRRLSPGSVSTAGNSGVGTVAAYWDAYDI